MVIELLFEVLIRPKSYFELIESDKAFAPSTARHINRFHFFFEALALLTFIPELQCLGRSDFCLRSSKLSMVQASADAVVGGSHAVAARGRFIMGITFLRFFGVVRHWKQMWISNTLRPKPRYGLEKWMFPQERNVDDFALEERSSRRKKFDVSTGMGNTALFKIGGDLHQRIYLLHDRTLEIAVARMKV